MAEVIITEFRAETAQFVASIDKAEAAVIGLDKAEEDAEKSTRGLSQQLGSSAAKANAHRAAMAEVSKSADNMAKATDRSADAVKRSREEAARAISANKKLSEAQKVAAAAAGGISKEYAVLAAAEKKAREEAERLKPKFVEQIGLLNQLKSRIDLLNQKKLALTDPKQIALVNDELAEATENFNEINNQSSGLGSRISSIFDRLAGGVPVIGQFLQALGPVGTAIGAVVSGFLAIIKNTDAGATAIEGFGRGASFTFDRITGLAKRFAESLSGLFVNSDGEANVFIATLTKVGDKFLDILTLGATSLVRDSLLEDQAAGKELAEQLDEIQDKQLGVNEATAKNEITIRKNLAALRDITKPLEERLRLADQITTVEKENLRIQREQLKEELKLALLEAKIIESRKEEVDDDLKARISGIKTAVFNLEAESVSLTERVAARRAGIVEEEEQRKRTAREKSVAEAARAQAKSLADAEKADAAQKKAEADRLKLEADTLAAENEIAGIRTAIAAADLSDIQKRDAAVRASFEKQIEVARAAFAKLSNLATTDEDRADIARTQSELMIELAEAETAELERLRQQDIEGVREYGKSKEEIEIEAINKRFDIQAKETERLITSEEERTAILAQIESDRQAALLDIRTEANARAYAEQEAAQAANIALIEQGGARLSDFIDQIASGQIKTAEDFSKALISLTIDTVGSIVQAKIVELIANSATFGSKAGPVGAAIGLAGGVVIGAALKALLNQLKGGFADGGEVTKRSGPAVRRSNGDNVLATLQDREIVLSRASRARAERMFGKGVWGDLGVPGFGGSVDWSAALAKIAASKGPRDGGIAILHSDNRQNNLELPRGYDRGMIRASRESTAEQKRTNDILQAMAQQRASSPSKRLW